MSNLPGPATCNLIPVTITLYKIVLQHLHFEQTHRQSKNISPGCGRRLVPLGEVFRLEQTLAKWSNGPPSEGHG